MNPTTPSPRIYIVGGAVRDIALGFTPQDFDFVVVGATPDLMTSLGFTPVGLDFPVFLHPKTKDEYALARVERKTAAGYNGFAVDTSGVTLQEDLNRRDLTCNAMAISAGTLDNPIPLPELLPTVNRSSIIDPYQGLTDLDNKTLRHIPPLDPSTPPAFLEDPLRVIRVIRFLTRFGPDWTVANDTKELIASMIEQGQLSELTKERLWKEFSRIAFESYADTLPTLLTQYNLHTALNITPRPSFLDIPAPSLALPESTLLSIALFALFDPEWLSTCDWIPSAHRSFAQRTLNFLNAPADVSEQVKLLTASRLFNLTDPAIAHALGFASSLAGSPAHPHSHAYSLLQTFHIANELKPATLNIPKGPNFPELLLQHRINYVQNYLAAQTALKS